MHITFCTKDKISDVMKFIDEHWRKDHVLSKNIDLMNYQHYDEVNDRYNYIVAYNEDDKIEGLLGFIPACKYDSTKDDYVWLSLWKTISKTDKNLGLKLLIFLEKNITHKLIGTLGISEEAEKIYKILRYKTGTLQQYYIVNPELNAYRVCTSPEHSSSINSKYLIQFEELTKIENIELEEINNYSIQSARTIQYAISKYQKHPVYKYYYLYFKTLNMVLVIRKIIVANITIVRIVDILGNAYNVKYVSSSLQKYLIDNGYEYVDFLNEGLNEEELLNNGFSIVDNKKNDTIIPMYFEPFLQENKTIGFAYKTKLEHILLFKADADQDRPNIS